MVNLPIVDTQQRHNWRLPPLARKGHISIKTGRMLGGHIKGTDRLITFRTDTIGTLIA